MSAVLEQAATAAQPGTNFASNLWLKPSRKLPRTLSLDAFTYTRITASMGIGKAWTGAAFAGADISRVRVTYAFGTKTAAIWLDDTAFTLTDAELPLVEAWLAQIRAAQPQS